MKQNAQLCCWKCGNHLSGELFPLRREEVCSNCGADLHVCNACKFYNPNISDSCDEPVAFPVHNKERANFCDYFKYSNSCFTGSASTPNRESRSELESLFGLSEKEQVQAGGLKNSNEALNRLFGLEDG